jgi:hypothetical protein
LFQDTRECAGRKLIRRLARDRDATWFEQMLVLPVTSPCRDKKPPVILNHSDRIADFHRDELFQDADANH